MPRIEHVIRLRCAQCMTAVEFFNHLDPPKLPVTITNFEMTIVAPPGWTSDAKGFMRCPVHEEQLVKPALHIPSVGGH